MANLTRGAARRAARNIRVQRPRRRRHDRDGRVRADAAGARWEISEREAHIGFQDIDTNDDGLIDFEEFVAWWTED